MESFVTLKNKGYKAFCDLCQENIREDERKPTRRQYYASRKETMERLAEEYPISNELVEPEDGIIDAKALDYIMEIGMLVKIYQAGLIDENTFAKAKENVSKRYGIYSLFAA